MDGPGNDNRVSHARPHVRSLAAIMRWLTEPADSLPEPLRRRSRLLAWLLLFILLLITATIVLVLVDNPARDPRRSSYIGLILALNVMIFLAFNLNRAGRYSLSAGLTIAGAVLAPWGSLIMDPVILQGDFVPLTYVVVPILLSSILLPTGITIAVAVFQLVALALIPRYYPATGSINWPSLLAFVVFTSVLGVLAGIIRERDLVQIDWQTSLLVQNAAQLRDLSIRDHLTTLFNRRYLDETLEREIQRAARSQAQLGIIMMDIDHFKRFNDKYGHAAGDELLKEMGKLLYAHIRMADIACRYGGEEFVLVLPDASLEVSRQRAERLRQEVKQLRLKIKNQNMGAITVSLGVAVFPDNGSSGKALLKSADAALYLAKRAGRDRVVMAA